MDMARWIIGILCLTPAGWPDNDEVGGMTKGELRGWKDERVE